MIELVIKKKAAVLLIILTLVLVLLLFTLGLITGTAISRTDCDRGNLDSAALNAEVDAKARQSKDPGRGGAEVSGDTSLATLTEPVPATPVFKESEPTSEIPDISQPKTE